MTDELITEQATVGSLRVTLPQVGDALRGYEVDPAAHDAHLRGRLFEKAFEFVEKAYQLQDF